MKMRERGNRFVQTLMALYTVYLVELAPMDIEHRIRLRQTLHVVASCARGHLCEKRAWVRDDDAVLDLDGGESGMVW